MRITINDVGARAGVSVGTVSNVLNAPHLVAPTTRLRVQTAIDELGYRPSRAARSLQAKRTYLIGYRLPSSKSGINETLDEFLHEMVATAGDHGLEVVLFGSSGQDEVSALRELVSRGDVDGLVISETNYDDPRIDYLCELGFPFVSFGRSRAKRPFPWVDVDGAAGMAEVVRHLAERGHHRIGLVAWPEESESGDDRFEGYRRAVEELELDADSALVVRAELGFDEGRRAWARLASLATPPTAVACVADTLALGVMAGATASGLRVGLDLAVTGFDDTAACRFVEPDLTSVRQPMAAIGRLLVDLLVARLEGSEEGTQGIRVRPVLMPRRSSERRRE